MWILLGQMNDNCWSHCSLLKKKTNSEFLHCLKGSCGSGCSECYGYSGCLGLFGCLGYSGCLRYSGCYGPSGCSERFGFVCTGSGCSEHYGFGLSGCFGSVYTGSEYSD